MKRKRALVYDWKGSWVGHRASLDMLAKKNIFARAVNRDTAISQSLY
jgi:hypothetical protein